MLNFTVLQKSSYYLIIYIEIFDKILQIRKTVNISYIKNY